LLPLRNFLTELSCDFVIDRRCLKIENEDYADIIFDVVEFTVNLRSSQFLVSVDPRVVSRFILSYIASDCPSSVIYGWMEINREGSTKNEEAKERMSHLLMVSKLLSAGMENHHIFLFSKVTNMMIDFLTVTNYNTFLELPSAEKRENCCCRYNKT